MYLVLLKEHFNTTGQTLHSFALVIHHLLKIHTDTANVDTVVRKILRCVLEKVSGVQECLGRNATNVQAGTTKRTTRFNADSL